MGKSIVAGLIRARLRNHSEERALTREIVKTVSSITTTLVNVKGDAYTEALAVLAADNMPLYEVIKGLSRNPSPTQANTTLLENALVAAAALNQTSYVQALIKLGARARCRTRFFGDALHTATTHTSPKTFLSILGTALATDEQFNSRFAALRIVIALEHAAAQDRADIFSTELWTSIKETYEHSGLHEVFNLAIMAATLASYNSVVLAIFDLLRSYDSDFLGTVDSMN